MMHSRLNHTWIWRRSSSTMAISPCVTGFSCQNSPFFRRWLWGTIPSISVELLILKHRFLSRSVPHWELSPLETLSTTTLHSICQVGLQLVCERRLWSTSVLHHHFQQAGLFLSCNRTVFRESFILALVTHRSSFSWTHFDWTQLFCEREDGCVWEWVLSFPVMNRPGFVEIDWVGYKGVPWR